MLNDLKLKQLQHGAYYIKGADLHLLAQHTIFRVHSYFFTRESQKFRDELMIPASPGKTHQGFSDDNAFVVDTSPEQLTTFLKVFYNPKYTLWDEMGVTDWATVLNLAHDWRFPEVKNLAIRELQKVEMDTVQRMDLYQKCNVDPVYLLPLYAEMCSREEPPTQDESNILGMETTFNIFRARERVRAQPGSPEGKSALPAGVAQDHVLITLRRLLSIETDNSTMTNSIQANGQDGKPPSGSSLTTKSSFGASSWILLSQEYSPSFFQGLDPLLLGLAAVGVVVTKKLLPPKIRLVEHREWEVESLISKVAIEVGWFRWWCHCIFLTCMNAN
ncbi:hypothetical protein BDQ12DRAFT_48490 [Crucibulum laeve]|uniref:BTB domain-containing protein n=1 Tax=Crucibulum laeve TaxID=68775 RepID=A0A5C3MJL3_9AGAR|nr:hypothetical protein BDQ12DRAFT_48490 [Crucibulum laeve]